VTLRDWQRHEIDRIYNNKAGTRRAILSFGRKNGKTALAALLLLVHLCGPERRPNSQLYSAATSREQAAVLFALAAKIVRLSPRLRDNVQVADSAKRLYCPDMGTTYRALSADATTAYGLSPVFIVHDELGQVKGPRSELYEALETAVAAQEEPLSIIISTQAPTDADLLSVLIDDAKAGHDPRVVLSVYSASDDLDPFSEEAIKAANPAFGDFQNAAEVLAMAEDARRMPSREPEYRNLILNQRVEVNAPFVSRITWMSCVGAVVPDFGPRPQYGGLDLSEVNDLTAFVPIADVDGAWHVKPVFWLPEEGLRERSRKDRVPYDQWAKEGHLTLIPGKTVDYDFVARHIAEIIRTRNVQKIAFDRWNWMHFRPAMIRAGLSDVMVDKKFMEFGQGYKSMSPALRDLEAAILSGRIRHSSHPVLNMCAANAVIKMDEAGNRKLDKPKSRGRIDGMVSLAMAYGAAPQNKPVPTYQVLVL
jgi:phage terminase large subunit-like protein